MSHSKLSGIRSDFLDGSTLIANQAVRADTEIEIINPATGEKISTAPALSAKDAEYAIDANIAAASKWRRTAPAERAQILKAWHCEILDNRDQLAVILTAEQGKPLKEAGSEIDYAASFVSWFAEEAQRIYGDVATSGPSHRILVIKQPVGVVAAITPWNFPAAMITRKVAPALAAGCTVTLKPSELTPLTALALGRLAFDAGLPPGVFNIVTGMPDQIGPVLTAHQAIRKLTFTGSTAVGKFLMGECAKTLKKISMELGGNAPLIVFNDADIDTAVDGAIASKFRNTGQTCVCANRILVQDRIHDQFVDALTARVAKMIVGDGLEGETDQGPLINSSAFAKVEAHVADAKKKGAIIITGGAGHEAGPLFYQPTVLTNATLAMRLASEETFGPVASIFQFSDEAEAVKIANLTKSGLAAYAFTRDPDRLWRLADDLEAGILGMNTGQISTAIAPFGGIKESGLGREGGHYGIDEFIEIKTAHFGVRA